MTRSLMNKKRTIFNYNEVLQDKDTKNSGGTNMNFLENESDNNFNSNLYFNHGKSTGNIFSNMKHKDDS